MPDKYLKQNGGVLTEQEALATSAGALDAGKIPALDASGKLSSTMLPIGVGAASYTVVASENLAYGDFVNVWNDGDVAKVRKASAADATKPAHGFVDNNVTAAQQATVFTDWTNSSVSGKTPGAVQFLSATVAGATTEVAPSGAGQLVQRLGISFSATAIDVEIAQGIILAP